MTEEGKLWLFDLAHGNLNDTEQVLKGFVKYYVLQGRGIGNVQDDIVFHTSYGVEGVRKAIETLKSVLMSFAGVDPQ